MLTDEKVKNGFQAWYMLCPFRHFLTLVSGLVILAHLLTRPLRDLNYWLSEHMVRPAHLWLSTQTGRVPFSVAELLIALLVFSLAYYLISQLLKLFQPHFFLRLYRTLATLVTLALTVYAGFCLLWGVYYYGDDFIAKSSLKNEPISVEQLERVTTYFADLASEAGERVQRDENGVYAGDRGAIIDRSPALYRAVEKKFPCLTGPELPVKGVMCSKIMSYLDFTGFFFPFTAEANVNLDFPPALFASTVAHELAHQRGVAKEQEANFVAVLACLEDGDPDYVYSAALLAYTHLGNALRKADPEAWSRVYKRLSEGVLADFAADRAYWKQFETPVQTVSNTVYEGFLHSYDQSLGLKSYGACVDLLVNYYDSRIPDAPRPAFDPDEPIDLPAEEEFSFVEGEYAAVDEDDAPVEEDDAAVEEDDAPVEAEALPADESPDGTAPPEENNP